MSPLLSNSFVICWEDGDRDVRFLCFLGGVHGGVATGFSERIRFWDLLSPVGSFNRLDCINSPSNDDSRLFIELSPLTRFSLLGDDRTRFVLFFPFSFGVCREKLNSSSLSSWSSSLHYYLKERKQTIQNVSFRAPTPIPHPILYINNID